MAANLAYSDFLFPQVLPPVVYHYTSHTGLLGIVKSGSIWATNIRYLNDARELDLAVDILREVLNYRRAFAAGWQLKVIRLLEQKWLARIFPDSTIYVFTCSFSEKGDLLSQWRGYAPPGAGYAVGFKPSLLRKAAGKQGFIFGRCIYDHETQFAAVEEVVDNHLGLATGQPPIPAVGDWEDRLAFLLFTRFFARAPLIKDASFAEEREWRLIGSPITRFRYEFPPIEHRTSGSLIVTYVSVALGKSDTIPLHEIVVGPTPHSKLARNSLIQFLRSQKVRVRVWRSAAPFRQL